MSNSHQVKDNRLTVFGVGWTLFPSIHWCSCIFFRLFSSCKYNRTNDNPNSLINAHTPNTNTWFVTTHIYVCSQAGAMAQTRWDLHSYNLASKVYPCYPKPEGTQMASVAKKLPIHKKQRKNPHLSISLRYCAKVLYTQWVCRECLRTEMWHFRHKPIIITFSQANQLGRENSYQISS